MQRRNFQILIDKYTAAVHSPSCRMDVVEDIYNIITEEQVYSIERFLIDVLYYDTDPIVRHEAACSLGKLRSEERIEGAMAFAALCHAAAEDTSIVVRHECIEWLFVFQSHDVLSVLEKFIKDPVKDIRATACISWARFKSGSHR